MRHLRTRDRTGLAPWSTSPREHRLARTGADAGEEAGCRPTGGPSPAPGAGQGSSDRTWSLRDSLERNCASTRRKRVRSPPGRGYRAGQAQSAPPIREMLTNAWSAPNRHRLGRSLLMTDALRAPKRMVFILGVELTMTGARLPGQPLFPSPYRLPTPITGGAPCYSPTFFKS